MITFIPLQTTNRVLRIINDCIQRMIQSEIDYYNCIKRDSEEVLEFLEDFFPSHLCREETQKCINVLHDLYEWTEDNYMHNLSSVHKHALSKIFEGYFNVKEDFENDRSKGERNIYKFSIKNIEDYEPYEIEVLRKINDRSFYEEDLFDDLDFSYIEDIVHLYQTNKNAFRIMGVNLKNYLELMPKDIRKQIEFDLQNKELEEEEKRETEDFVINQISNVIKQMEMNPVRLEKSNENEISDDIKDRLQFSLEMKGINIEREARGGFAEREIGEIDFFLYKNENHKYLQLAIGENKVWGNFENQIKQLLGYANKNINFGFTIVINKNNTYQEIKDSQKEILKKFNLNDSFKLIQIEEWEDVLISTHIIPEENKLFKIYHFVLNTNTQARKQMAYEARNKNIENNKITITQSNEETKTEELDKKELINSILTKIEQVNTFEDMLDILNNLEKVIFESEAYQIIKRLKEIGTAKRRKASIVVDGKKYNNIQVFNQKDSPLMTFIQKIRNEKSIPSIAMHIQETIKQYKELGANDQYVIKIEYLKQAIEIAQKKYHVLDLMANKKIDIYIVGKKREDFKSYLYKDFFNENFEVFIYTAEDAIYTVLHQLGSITNMILCDERATVPKEFIKVNKKVKVDLLKASIEDRIRCFSDIFAITILKNSCLESAAPFLLNDEANKILEEYFINEIENKIKTNNSIKT